MLALEGHAHCRKRSMLIRSIPIFPALVVLTSCSQDNPPAQTDSGGPDATTDQWASDSGNDTSMMDSKGDAPDSAMDAADANNDAANDADNDADADIDADNDADNDAGDAADDADDGGPSQDANPDAPSSSARLDDRPLHEFDIEDGRPAIVPEPVQHASIDALVGVAFSLGA